MYEGAKHMHYFIVNLHARSGLAKTVWNDLKKELETKKIPYQVTFTEYQNHATEITKELTSSISNLFLIVLGGDGTLNEVINGITDFTQTTVGYIPIGSGNDFARGVGLPSDPKDALKLALDCPFIHKIDVGEISFKNQVRRFIVSSGIGFDADICHKATTSKFKILLNKMKLGKLSYVLIALNRLFSSTPVSLTLQIDGTKTHTFSKTYFAAFMNSPYEGGGVKFCPNAKNNDHMLDFIVVSDVSKIKILLVLPLALLGLHTKVKGVHTGICKQARITTSSPLPVHTDGEPIQAQRTVNITCCTNKLRIITNLISD